MRNSSCHIRFDIGDGDTMRMRQISYCRLHRLWNAASALGVGTYDVDIKINGGLVGSAVFALK
jgi:hypothetical protein